MSRPLARVGQDAAMPSVVAHHYADDKAQDPARLAAEARRLRARVAELEALLRANKPLPDSGAGTPEPHP